MSTQIKHTPGPWIVEIHGRFLAENAPICLISKAESEDGVLIAGDSLASVTTRFFGKTEDYAHWRANAFLMAAAPKMFALIQEAIDQSDADAMYWEKWNSRAKAIIAEAKGESL